MLVKEATCHRWHRRLSEQQFAVPTVYTAKITNYKQKSICYSFVSHYFCKTASTHVGILKIMVKSHLSVNIQSPCSRCPSRRCYHIIISIAKVETTYREMSRVYLNNAQSTRNEKDLCHSPYHSICVLTTKISKTTTYLSSLFMDQMPYSVGKNKEMIEITSSFWHKSKRNDMIAMCRFKTKRFINSSYTWLSCGYDCPY